MQAFLNSEAVKDALNATKSPLAAITVLKKICVHPQLLSDRAADAVASGGNPYDCCGSLNHLEVCHDYCISGQISLQRAPEVTCRRLYLLCHKDSR